jgi:hypothetical protein
MSGPTGHPGLVVIVPLTSDTVATAQAIKDALSADAYPLLSVPYEADGQQFLILTDYKKA